MKDFSNFVTEKPFPCDVEGCSMKFTNEDHLRVHKKRHDMILNLGLTQRGVTFTDQTPTPTQFIRNCEEVGLFQDLQNVNPFEETFKKAVEAAKSGQPLSLKLSQTSQPDDTLHTPNIFPHITDVNSLNNSESCNKSENIPPCEDELLLKPEITESEQFCGADNPVEVDTQTTSNQTQELLTGLKNSDSKPLKEGKLILNVTEGHLLQVLGPDNPQNSCNMVVIKDSVSDVFPPLPLTVKEKLKKNLSEKKSGRCMQPKVPILKCPLKRTSNSLSNEFAKFSKNAMKLISKLETTSESEISEMLCRRPKKNDKFQGKGSRSDFLARKRAASFRCREKKKLYLLYLEKVNSELLAANHNLELINSVLCKEICELRNELLKHKCCSAADKNTEAVLSTSASLLAKKTPVEGEKRTKLKTPSKHLSSVIKKDSKSVESVQKPTMEESISSDSSGSFSDLNNCSLDVAEVILDNEPDEKEIPLNEVNKPPDIIVRFNSVTNDSPTRLLPDFHLGKYLQGAGEKVKQIYSEHCYFLNKPPYPHMNINKSIVNYKTFREAITTVSQLTSDDQLDSLEIQMKKNDSLSDITSLKTKVTIGPRTSPPLILLKPFKKRSLQSKKLEKT